MNHVLIVSKNATIRLEFQSYLHSILGKHIAFDTIGLYQVHDESQIKGYQCILFSSSQVQSEFPIPIPGKVFRLTCSRTFNHALLDQIIRIPPNEAVYVVNDTYESILDIIEQLKDAGIVQYHFVPYYPGCVETDETIHYAITVGEPQLVPAHVKNIVDIGNRIIDIATINELCSCFRLPSSLSNQITKSYINRILQIVKLTGTYYGEYIYSQQLLQAVISNLPIGLCILACEGEITMMNRNFAIDLELPETSSGGKRFASLLPAPYASYDFCQSADYELTNKNGGRLHLSVLELTLPNHAPLYMLISKPSMQPHNPDSEAGEIPSSDFYRINSGFMNIITESPRVRRSLEYARRLALYDFPVLIQGESGTQKKMIARAIHKLSSRRQQPFVTFDHLSARPDAVREGTNQITKLLCSADKGTLLIANTEHLSLEIQDLLLSALQNSPAEKLTQPLNIRIISTAGHDLYDDVLAGTFREELFFLLNAVSMDTIPLRERREDIPLLMEHFFQSLFHDSNIHTEHIISSSLMDFLLSYDYPGNVQELFNLTRYFFSHYAAHPLIMAQLPSYISRRLNEFPSLRNPVRLKVLEIIAASPRIGRGGIIKVLEESDVKISDGKLRGLLKELSEDGLIHINRTKGGCEITELGLMSIKP